MKTEMQKRIINFQVDSFNMVHHARYLELMEEGRWLYCYENNLMGHFMSMGIYHVVANINIDYRSSTTCGDLITVATELTGVTHKSVLFTQTVFRERTILAAGEITNVFLRKPGNVIINVKDMAPFWDDIDALQTGIR